MYKLRYQRQLEKQKFEIDTLIQTKDDEIHMLSKLNEECQMKIQELKECSSKLSHDIDLMKGEQSFRIEKLKAEKETRIAAIKTKNNLEIIDLQNKIKEKNRIIEEENRDKLNQIKNKNEERTKQILDQLDQQINETKTNVNNITLKCTEAKKLISNYPQSLCQSNEENSNNQAISSLQKKVQDKQNERIQCLKTMKDQLQECVNTLIEEEEQFSQKIEYAQINLKKLNHEYESTIQNLKNQRQMEKQSQIEKFQQVQKNLKHLIHVRDKKINQFQNEFAQTKNELETVRARTMPISRGDISRMGLIYEAERNKMSNIIEKLKNNIHVKEKKLEEIRQKNSQLKREICQVEHYIRFNLSFPIQSQFVY